jgi:hypothetical protein
MKKRDDKAWAESLLDAAFAQCFYGKLTLHIENGNIVRATKEQSLKPPSLEKDRKSI